MCERTNRIGGVVQINKSKTVDIHAYNMVEIEEKFKNGGSLKTAREKLAIGSNIMYAVGDKKKAV